MAAIGGVAKPLAAAGDDGAEGPVARGTARPVGGAADEDDASATSSVRGCSRRALLQDSRALLAMNLRKRSPAVASAAGAAGDAADARGTAGDAAGANGAEAERARSVADAGGAAGPVAAGGGVAKPEGELRGPWQVVKDRAEGPVAGGTAGPVASAANGDANPSEGLSAVRARYVAVLVAEGTSADNAAKDSQTGHTHYLYKA